MKSLLGIFVLILFVQVLNSACPTGTFAVPGDLGSKWPCISLVEYPLSFINAEYACEAQSGNLLPIHNGFFNTFVSQMALATGKEPDFWLGVTSMIGGDWRYVDDGTLVNYTAWASGQPNNISNLRFCTHMQTDGLWYSQYCNETLNFACGVLEVGARDSSVKTYPLPSEKRKTYEVLSTKKNTPLGPKSSECRSYVPLSFDVSTKLTPKQFKEIKDFIYNMFSAVILSDKVKPASISTYGKRNYPLLKPESLIETVVYILAAEEQTTDLDSDITKPLRSFIAEGEDKHMDGIPVNALVFAGSELKDTKISEAQKYVNKLTANGNTVTVVLVNPTIDQTNYKKVQGLNVVLWSDPVTLASNLKANLKCASE